MHLKSIVLKGFKSFPDRTKLDFGTGVSRHRRAQRVRQVERHRRRALGDGRAVAARRPRPVDAGRDLRRRSRRAGAQQRRGRDRARQQRRHGRPAARRDLDPAPPGPQRRRRVPPQRREVPAGRRARGPVGHRPGQGDALGRLPGPRRGDRHLQAQGPPAADRGGGRARASTASAAAARSSSSSAPRTTSTARWTSSARPAPGCGRSSARPRPPSCTSASSARRPRPAGSSPATPSAPAAPSWLPPRRRRRGPRRP